MLNRERIAGLRPIHAREERPRCARRAPFFDKLN